jgi:hypothetical protein
MDTTARSGATGPTVLDAIPRPAPWMVIALIAAGVYNLLWGAVAIIWPTGLFDLAGMEPPRYASIWQCVGMIVGVYGVGYLVAARDPLRHWPIVLVGLLGKVFGPVGFVGAAARGELPWAFGWTIITNDLVWWAPFAAILWRAFSHHTARAGLGDAELAAPLDRRTAIEQAVTNRGASLDELSRRQPTLVVFLRHAGCTFCREALDDIALARDAIEADGAEIVLVHMGEDAQAADFFARYGLEDLPRVADPQRELYRAFNLQRGSAGQLLGPRVWWRGLLAFARGHGVGKLAGDGFQMPGAFLLSDGIVVRSFRHRRASDRPDYAALTCERPDVDVTDGAAPGGAAAPVASG